ncbi:kynurenine formamidase [Plakobranchus ocellatus]|uniref:Kynurenine formamidase n=1 Tax=Plakobranchus ocellatus TaxID=259542 RepID=A0AAV4A2T8_9GAST|nr:kynurenine formamidase [Plakobranchus ocellatus]
MTWLMITILIRTIVCAFPAAQAYKLVELTHSLSPSTLFWPGVPSFNRSLVVASVNQHGVWFEIGKFSVGEHGGTHIDVPRHFKQGAADLNDFPLDRTIAEGVMIDCSAEAAKNYNYAVTTNKLKEWEKKNGRIPDGAAVLVNFGYTAKFSNHQAFLNTKNVRDDKTFRFPFVTAQAALWLLNERKMKIIGVDVPSPDSPQDKSYPVHVALLLKNVMIMEMMNIPKSLPARGFRVHCAPIRIVDGTGVQTRIYAMMGDNIDAGSARLCMQSPVFFVASLVVASAVVDILTGGRIRG